MLLRCHNVGQGLRERSGAETEACQKGASLKTLK